MVATISHLTLRRCPCQILVALVILVAVAMGLPGAAFAADDEAREASAVSNGAQYTFTVEDGEACVTKIEKAPGNDAATYEALVPDVVGIDAEGAGYVPGTATADGKDTFLVTSIGANAAGGKISEKSGAGWDYVYNDEITRIRIPALLLSIGDQAFAGCRKVTAVEFPVDQIEGNDEHRAHVESIGSMAFAACESVGAWELPDSVISVGSRAFGLGGCASATSLRLPAAPTAWGTLAGIFDTMPVCTQVTVPEGCVNLPWLRISKVERLVLPSTLRGNVTVLAASGPSQLSEVLLTEGCALDSLSLEVGDIARFDVPEGVKDLSLRGNFSEVILPSTLTTITTLWAPNLKNLAIPASVRRIGGYSINCPALETIEFSPFSQLTRIDQHAFSGCRALTSLDLPEGLVTLDGMAISGCNALTDVTLPASLENIATPFYNCANLKRVAFAKGSRVFDLQTIAEDCPALEEVSLPENAVTINAVSDYLVKGSPKLARVYTFNPKLTLSAELFDGCGKEFAVYGWGVSGNVLDSCEDAGLAFVPYAELDESGYCGTANARAVATNVDAAEVTCSFGLATSFDYARMLVAGDDYTVGKARHDDLDWLRVVGNGVTCFGEVEIPAKQDIDLADVAPIARQVIGNGASTARPRPSLTLGGRVLVAGRDYTLAWRDNERAGTGVVVATGIGNYTGAKEIEFAVGEEHDLTAALGGAGSGGAAGAEARAQVALAAAQMPGMPQACGTVVVAWAHDAKALATGAALAVAEDAQLIAVSNASGLTDAQKGALVAWGASRALVIGGDAACGAGAVADLKAAGLTCTSFDVENVVAASSRWGATAVVAGSGDPAQLAAAAAYAGTVGGPLLTAQPDGTLSASALEALGKFDNVVIAGDCFAVDDSAEAAIAAAGSTAFRAQDAAALVSHGRAAGIYADADASYVVAPASASVAIPYAVCAARSRVPFLTS